eukprot:Rmarinus@m.26675
MASASVYWSIEEAIEEKRYEWAARHICDLHYIKTTYKDRRIPTVLLHLEQVRPHLLPKSSARALDYERFVRSKLSYPAEDPIADDAVFVLALTEKDTSSVRKDAIRESRIISCHSLSFEKSARMEELPDTEPTPPTCVIPIPKVAFHESSPLESVYLTDNGDTVILVSAKEMHVMDRNKNNLRSFFHEKPHIGVTCLPGGVMVLRSPDALDFVCVHTGEVVRKFFRHSPCSISSDLSAALSPFPSNPQVVVLWSITCGLPILTYEKHTSAVSALCFDRTGGRFVSGSMNGEVFVWETATAVCLRQMQGFSPEDWVSNLCLHRDGVMIVVVTSRVLGLWDIDHGTQVGEKKLLLEPNSGEAMRITTLCFGPRTQLLFTDGVGHVFVGEPLRSLCRQIDCGGEVSRMRDSLKYCESNRCFYCVMKQEVFVWDVKAEDVCCSIHPAFTAENTNRNSCVMKQRTQCTIL